MRKATECFREKKRGTESSTNFTTCTDWRTRFSADFVPWAGQTLLIREVVTNDNTSSWTRMEIIFLGTQLNETLIYSMCAWERFQVKLQPFTFGLKRPGPRQRELGNEWIKLTHEKCKFGNPRLAEPFGPRTNTTLLYQMPVSERFVFDRNNYRAWHGSSSSFLIGRGILPSGDLCMKAQGIYKLSPPLYNKINNKDLPSKNTHFISFFGLTGPIGMWVRWVWSLRFNQNELKTDMKPCWLLYKRIHQIRLGMWIFFLN